LSIIPNQIGIRYLIEWLYNPKIGFFHLHYNTKSDYNLTQIAKKKRVEKRMEAVKTYQYYKREETVSV